MSDSALKHIEHLAVTIGPRGSATPKEKEGHDYVHQVLSGLGLEPRVEEYLASPYIYLQFALAMGAMLIAEVLYWFLAPTPNAGVGALAAAVLAIVVTVSVVLQLLGDDNPLRWFTPAERSQNVIAITPAGGEAKRKVVVMAHVDTHRTPAFWRTPRTFVVYRALSALGLFSLAALVVIYLIGIFAPSGTLRLASLVPTFFILLVFLMVLQAHFTPFTAGANDNASGVGVMLALAEKAKQQPLQSAELWWVATSCEEVGGHGSADFVRRHRAELADATVINVDNIAGKETGPVYLRSEGILIPKDYPAGALALADEVAQARPELGARSVVQRGAGTDGWYPLKAGIKCLSFVGYTRDGWVPNWHNPSDVFANVDADAVDRTERYVWAVLQKLEAA
jgi:hypothetical protein